MGKKDKRSLLNVGMDAVEDSKLTTKSFFQQTIFGVGLERLKWTVENEGPILIVEALLSWFPATLIVGYFTQMVGIMHREYRHYSFLRAIQLGAFTWWTLAIWVFLFYILTRINRLVSTEYIYDKERNLKISTHGSSGTSHPATEKELRETFKCGSIKELTCPLLAQDKNNPDRYFGFDINAANANGNIWVCGISRSGKGVGYVINTIAQAVREGTSLVVMDPKGELYRSTHLMAMSHGYKVWMINFKDGEMQHSDACNFMQVVKNNNLKAITFASTIIDNTDDSTHPTNKTFWDKAELNLLGCAVLFINNQQGLLDVPNTIGEVYNLITENSVEKLVQLFGQLRPSHPAYRLFSAFKGNDAKTQGEIKSGLSYRLSILANSLIQKITGEDGLIFEDCGKEPTVVYLVVPDDNDSMRFLIALFCQCMYSQLIKYADNNDNNGNKLDVPVRMLLDEFPSVGRIPDFEKKLSTVLGRGINTTIITQTKEQLEDMYPTQYHTILANCGYWVLLKSNDDDTAKMLSDKSGVMTVVEESIRDETGWMQLFHLFMHSQKTIQLKDRAVYFTDEINRMASDRVLIFPSGHNCTMQKKMKYYEMPIVKEIVEAPIKQHIPDWVFKCTDMELEELGIDKAEMAAGYKKETPIPICTEEDFNKPINKKMQYNAIMLLKDRFGTREDLDEALQDIGAVEINSDEMTVADRDCRSEDVGANNFLS